MVLWTVKRKEKKGIFRGEVSVICEGKHSYRIYNKEKKKLSKTIIFLSSNDWNKEGLSLRGKIFVEKKYIAIKLMNVSV